MAEGGKITGSTEEDDLLYCTVCMEEYEDPRALPCLHTFCYRCLTRLSLKEGTISSSQVKLRTNDSQQKEILICPLCSEEHPIPKDKGVAGFRKDFRIHKLKERQKEVQIKEKSSMLAGTVIEKCSFHPDEKLRFHCENDSCNLDICEVCWTDSHDKHTVTLLSKKLKDARDVLRKDVGKNMEIVVSQLEILSQARKQINDRYGKVKDELKSTQKKLQSCLQSIFDKHLAELDRQKKMQVDSISGQICSISALKNSFKEIQNDIDKANVPITSKTLDRYSEWQNQMLQASSDLDKWSYSFSCIQLPDGKVQTKNFCTVKEAIETTMTFSSYDISIDSLTEKRGSKEELVSNPPETPNTDDMTHLKYVSSFETMWAIRDITVSRSNLLYAVNKNYLACFDVLSSAKEYHKQLLYLEAKAVALICSKTGTEFVVVLSELQKMLSFFLWQQKKQVSSYLLPHHPTAGILEGSGNLLAYVFNNGRKSYVSLLSVNNDLAEISTYGHPFEIPFESGRVRAMLLSISNRENPVLTCSSTFTPGSTRKSDTALVTLIISKEEPRVYWRMSFDELDSNISAFNLKSIACDNDNVFVVNTAVGTLYRITNIGRRVRKMEVTGKDFSFSSVNRFCLGSEVKNLYTSNSNNTISTFNYV